jgi:hypothetical protein
LSWCGKRKGRKRKSRSVIPSFLSHSFFSQSFLHFSVIPSFLSHSFFFSQSFLLSQSFPQLDPTCWPLLPSSSTGRATALETFGELSHFGPARQCGPLPYKKVPRPRTLNLAAAAPLETRNAAASFFPPPRRRLSLTADRPFRCTPDHHNPGSAPSRHPEAPLAQHRSPTPRHRPNFSKEPSMVSRSAVRIPHRRCILIRLNPLVTSAGSSPTDSHVQGTSSLSAAAFPTSAACSAARTSSPTIFRCSSSHHETWVSFPAIPWSFLH